MPRFRPIDLFVAELPVIPFLKAVQHDSHFTADTDNLEMALLDQPIGFHFLHPKYSLHFRDRDACFVHVNVPPM